MTILVLILESRKVICSPYPEKSLSGHAIGPLDPTSRTETGVACVVLLDFDPATFALTGSAQEGWKSEYRLGTKPFMAIETLDTTAGQHTHLYAHELESILYALVWLGVGYRGAEHPTVPRNQPDILRKWRVGNWEEVCSAKKDFLRMKSDLVLDNISNPVARILCIKLSIQFRIHYTVIDCYQEWLETTQRMKKNQYSAEVEDELASDVHRLFGSRPPKSVKKSNLPTEPPKPTYNIFPKILESLACTEPCTSDCCI